jgi:prevent-host-death family protein
MFTSIKYLKDHLSEVLRTVQLGEEVLVTYHEQPIAKITPVSDQEFLEKKNKLSFLEELKQLHAELKPYKLPPLSKAIVAVRKKERF